MLAQMFEQGQFWLLARPDASRLALLGSGTQAKMHLDAIAAVRTITSATVWSRHPEHAEASRAPTGARMLYPVARPACKFVTA